MAKKQTAKSDNDVKRAAYIRQAAMQWLDLNRRDVLTKIRELAREKHPPQEGKKSRSTFVLPKELADMK